MKRLLILIAAVVLFVSPSAAQDPAGEIGQIMKAFLVPFSNQNVDEFIEYVADDATAFFPASRFATDRIEGKASIARTFAGVFKYDPTVSRPLIQPQDLKVQTFGDTAIVTFHLGSNTARGRRTFVLRRVDGKWKIVHLHASSIS